MDALPVIFVESVIESMFDSSKVENFKLLSGIIGQVANQMRLRKGTLFIGVDREPQRIRVQMVFEEDGNVPQEFDLGNPGQAEEAKNLFDEIFRAKSFFKFDVALSSERVWSPLTEYVNHPVLQFVLRRLIAINRICLVLMGEDLSPILDVLLSRGPLVCELMVPAANSEASVQEFLTKNARFPFSHLKRVTLMSSDVVHLELYKNILSDPNITLLDFGRSDLTSQMVADWVEKGEPPKEKIILFEDETPFEKILESCGPFEVTSDLPDAIKDSYKRLEQTHPENGNFRDHPTAAGRRVYLCRSENRVHVYFV
ncbi:hypothetical protein L596_012940 [Steinernema carpocapsae]|uniref:Uncharacterized protein n=1 Tax=Steinernema carpocapsae TaxID=34508 RepID=A0A4U5NYX1_STECR|nr:hypothetical protein L596_012940 [Steinernema carpocapsae]